MSNIDLKEIIETIPDFPKAGIMFRDVTPILENSQALEYTAEKLAEYAQSVKADVIVAPEARGFFFGIPAAMKASLPFIPVRKPGKLPRKTVSQSYDLEYGSDQLEIHEDGIKPGQRVFIVDDLLATGGTVEAIDALVHKMGGITAGYGFVVELDDLKGKDRLNDAPVYSLCHYEGE